MSPAFVGGVVKSHRVAIIFTAPDDRGHAERAAALLEGLSIPTSLHVARPLQAPEQTAQLVKDSTAQVFIAVAPAGNPLASALAALTMRPVIQVPTTSQAPVAGLLGSIPVGAGVATVSLDRPEDAALVAASILGLADEGVQSAIAAAREAARREAIAADAAFRHGNG